MRVMGHVEFLDMPEGTVFSYGPSYTCFDSGLLIKSESIKSGEHWGFWALDPCWVDADDSGQAFDRLHLMSISDASFPMEEATGKYMDYDLDENPVFLVFEDKDLERLRKIMGNGGW